VAIFVVIMHRAQHSAALLHLLHVADHNNNLGADMRSAMIALGVLTVSFIQQAQAQPRIETVDCTSLVGLPTGTAATCGYLYVAENRADSHSRTIGVPFVRARSKRQPALPDPVFIIPGGPGERAFYPGYIEYQPALATRDVIWIDQRGTELAKPALQCPEYEQATQRALRGAIDGKELALQQTAAARTCADRAKREGIDLHHYSSRDIADDIDDLRALLGFKQVNVYAISYGGRIASTLVRLHPDSVRALVLNSPLPIEANYDEFGSANMQRTLDMVIAGCDTEPSCSGVLPMVRTLFNEVMMRAEKAPADVVLDDAAHPGTQIAARVTRWVLANALLGQLYSPYSFELLPKRLDAINRGDRSALKSIISIEPSRTALLQRLAVWCNDEFPFEGATAIQRQQTAFPLFAGVDQSTVPLGACDAAGLTQTHADQIENTAITTDKPVLIFGGEYDPTIPPSWLRAMASQLPNALVAIFPGQGHGAGFNECGWTMMQSFLDSAPNKIDASCLLKEHSPDFSRSSTSAN
jgi:pimeloyl-ACP methyl ester carboxylesterase